MKKLKKYAVAAIAILYVLSPIDLMPGIIVDDLIVVLLAFLQNRQLTAN